MTDQSSSQSLNSRSAFSSWVKDNGGDDDLIEFLAERGFSSKLSLKYLDLESEDGKALLHDLSLGK